MYCPNCNRNISQNIAKNIKKCVCGYNFFTKTYNNESMQNEESLGEFNLYTPLYSVMTFILLMFPVFICGISFKFLNKISNTKWWQYILLFSFIFIIFVSIYLYVEKTVKSICKYCKSFNSILLYKTNCEEKYKCNSCKKLYILKWNDTSDDWYPP